MAIIKPVIDVDPARLQALCARYGVARLEVFGSTARGEARPESDIDVLYTLVPGHRVGWEIEDLADELSVLLGAPVDLVSRRGLHARIREQVLHEVRPLYGAA